MSTSDEHERLARELADLEPQSPAEHWDRIEIMARNLDEFQDEPDTWDRWRRTLLLNPALRDTVIDLMWFADRLGLARGEASREFWHRQAAAEWQRVDAMVDDLLLCHTEDAVEIVRTDRDYQTRSVIWCLIYRYWKAPVGERGPWSRLIEAAAEPAGRGGGYDGVLWQLGRAYRAMEQLMVQPLGEANAFIYEPLAAAPPEADAWAAVDYMAIHGRSEAFFGHIEDATTKLEDSIALAAEYDLGDQEVKVSLALSRIQASVGVPTFERLESLARKVGKAIRSDLEAILKHSILIDRIYFAKTINRKVVDAELVHLGASASDTAFRAWIVVARGLLRIRGTAYTAAMWLLIKARDDFASQGRIHDVQWVRVFIAIAAGRAGDIAVAAEEGRQAALYFAEHSHGSVRERALAMVAAGRHEMTALLDLGHVLIAPRASKAPALLH